MPKTGSMAGWAAGDKCRQAILRSEDDDRHFMTLSFPRKREPRGGVSLRTLWIPAFAGMTKVGGPRTGIPTLHGSQRKRGPERSEEHTSELQSLMRISYAVFCLKKKKKTHIQINNKRNRMH